MISARRATSGDAGWLRFLIEQRDASCQFSADHFNIVFMNNLSNPDLVYIVVDLDGIPAAFGSLSFGIPLHTCKPVAKVQDFLIEERGLGKAIGAHLVNAMMLSARDRNCCRLEVDCGRLDKWSQRFFALHGFLMTHYKLSLNIDFKAE
jgi:hypothetical protein